MGIIIIDGAGGVNKANVDADGHLNVNVRPPAFQALGYYQQVAVSGNIAATLAANSALFSFRWADATRLCMIQSVKVGCIVTGTITTAVPFDLALFVARSFSASDTGGTGVGVPTNMQKMRSSMGSSLVTDFRMATTGTLTAVTRTLDTNPIARVQGNSGTAVGTQFFGTGSPQPLYLRDNVDHHPIILAQNEGFVVTAPLAGPASGTFSILVQVIWGELNSY
ncbi:MAG: hypothetical protein WBY94_19495 [Polyangiaceae bacterium]